MIPGSGFAVVINVEGSTIRSDLQRPVWWKIIVRLRLRRSAVCGRSGCRCCCGRCCSLWFSWQSRLIWAAGRLIVGVSGVGIGVGVRGRWDLLQIGRHCIVRRGRCVRIVIASGRTVLRCGSYSVIGQLVVIAIQADVHSPAEILQLRLSDAHIARITACIRLA